MNPTAAKFHEYTAEEITSFNRALYRGCGLPPISPGFSEINAWNTFLYVVRSFEHETAEGRFTLEDLVNVLAEINRENAGREPKFRRAMRPTAILRDPEDLRDRVLMAREKARGRRRPAKVTEARRDGDITHAIERDPAADHDAEPLSNELTRFIESNRLAK